MSNDPLDVMNFLKEKGTTTPPMTVTAEIVRRQESVEPSPSVDPVTEELAKGFGEKYNFTPETLPLDESQIPSKGTLIGSGPKRVRVPVGRDQEVMFQMTPDGRLVDEQGNEAPSFNPEQRCHLTVIDTIIHQLPDESAIPVDSRYTRWLTTDEQHSSRQKKIGEEWEPLDIGSWLHSCGMLMIKNREGGRKLVNPSIEQQEKERARIVEVAVIYVEPQEYVSFDNPVVFAKILPGESLRIHPTNISDLRIRCQSGQCRVSIDAFPE